MSLKEDCVDLFAGIAVIIILIFLAIVAILFAVPQEAAEIRREGRMNARKTS